MPAPEVLTGLDEIPGLRQAAEKLCGSGSAPRLASSVEFLLEGLHLSNKLNKSERSGSARYGRA
jgi:magnesium chelatase subunit I